jgi:hypothetical protein
VRLEQDVESGGAHAPSYQRRSSNVSAELRGGGKKRRTSRVARVPSSDPALERTGGRLASRSSAPFHSTRTSVPTSSAPSRQSKSGSLSSADARSPAFPVHG